MADVVIHGDQKMGAPTYLHVNCEAAAWSVPLNKGGSCCLEAMHSVTQVHTRQPWHSGSATPHQCPIQAMPFDSMPHCSTPEPQWNYTAVSSSTQQLRKEQQLLLYRRGMTRRRC